MTNLLRTRVVVTYAGQDITRDIAPDLETQCSTAPHDTRALMAIIIDYAADARPIQS